MIYTAPDGTVQLDVSLRDDTPWLSLQQLTLFFGRDKSVISRHLRNIFDSGELMRSSVVAKNATTAADGKSYIVESFNLDAIISVGYRVNSKRGTQFRIWATQVLRQHLVQGYTIREQRLLEVQGKYDALRKVVLLLGRTAGITRDPGADEAQGLLSILADYGRALDLLDRYDHQQLTLPKGERDVTFVLDYPMARAAIDSMAMSQGKTGKRSGLFGRERGGAFRGVLAAIDQTFDGSCLYPSVEEKPAHLLQRDHGQVASASTVGLVLTRRGLIDRRSAKRRQRAALHPKRRFPQGLTIRAPGDLVQLDTKFVVGLSGKVCYQFTAIDVLTKLRVLRAYPTQSSLVGAQFLHEVLTVLPFPVRAIQTDNGLPFLGTFQKRAAQRGLTHYFSRPRSPKENSYVERPHGSDEAEFYSRPGVRLLPLPLLERAMREWEEEWNTIRPHQSLNYLTPREYLTTWQTTPFPTRNCITLQT